MGKSMHLRPEQLYILAAMMKAKYIDYAYIAAMDDLENNYILAKKEIKDAIVRNGIASEDFSGNIEINDIYADTLKPIFFGDTQSEMDIIRRGEKDTAYSVRYHFYDGKITKVETIDGEYEISSVSAEKIKEDIDNAIKALNIKDKEEKKEAVSPDKADIVFSVKYMHLNKCSMVNTYFGMNGILYQDKDESLQIVDSAMLKQSSYNLLKGDL